MINVLLVFGHAEVIKGSGQISAVVVGKKYHKQILSNKTFQ